MEKREREGGAKLERWKERLMKVEGEEGIGGDSKERNKEIDHSRMQERSGIDVEKCG